MTSVINCRDITPLFEKEPVVLSKDGFIFYHALDQSKSRHEILVYSEVNHYTEVEFYKEYVRRLHAI